jgi:hypothetical protein
VLPGGRQPLPGATVTVRFDPNARRRLVLLEENFGARHGAEPARRLSVAAAVGGEG